ncbi:hypothetical protein RND71_019146 [Anisodus tanguticus]|uniref:Uncharacterized protein n=1 Tax=Anisodus tanguticus TaxID=243964 RepID=A0AAE1RWY9_9SOLA|nr:hypothetical protein RND71_019146 [Anisodus tanguticus]
MSDRNEGPTMGSTIGRSKTKIWIWPKKKQGYGYHDRSPSIKNISLDIYTSYKIGESYS